MIQMDKQALNIEGITIYRDHALDHQFWYHEQPVALARRNDKPQFTLISYRDRSSDTEVRSGGFLMLETEIKLDEATKRRIKSRLSGLTDKEPQLAPISYDEGSVQIMALDLQGAGDNQQPDLPEGSFVAVEKIFGTKSPSLTGVNNAVFGLQLSEEGVQIMEAAFKAGGFPVGVIYDLSYTALRPAISARVEANYKRMYDHLSYGIDFGVGGQIGPVSVQLRASLDFAFEKLVEQKVIKITITNFSTDDDREEKEKMVLDFFKETIIKDWFKPTLNPVEFDSNRDLFPDLPGGGGDTGGGDTGGGDTDGGDTGGGDTGGGDTDGGDTDGGDTDGGDTDGGDTDGGDTDGGDTDGGDTGGDDTGGNVNEPEIPNVDTPTIPLAHSSSRKTVAMNDQSSGNTTPGIGVQLAFQLKKIKQQEDKYAVLEYDRADAVQLTYGAQGLIGILASDLDDAHFLRVDTDGAFFRTLDIKAQAPSNIFENLGLAAVDVAIDYGNEDDEDHIHHKDFRFAANGEQTGEVKFFLNRALDLHYSLTNQYHFDPLSGWIGEKITYQMPARPTLDRTLMINPFNDLGFLQISIAPASMDTVLMESTDVHLSYTDGNWTTSKVINVRPDSAEQFWKLRLTKPDAREFSHYFVHHLANGESVTTEPVTQTATVVPVTDPFEDPLVIEFFPNYDASQIQKLFVDVTYHDQANSYKRKQKIIFEPAETSSKTVRFARMNTELGTFSYRITILGVDRSVRRLSPETGDETLVFLGEKVASGDSQ